MATTFDQTNQVNLEFVLTSIADRMATVPSTIGSAEHQAGQREAQARCVNLLRWYVDGPDLLAAEDALSV